MLELAQLSANRMQLPLLPEELELRGFLLLEAALSQRPSLATSLSFVSNIPSFIPKRSWFSQYMRKAIIVDFALKILEMPTVQDSFSHSTPSPSNATIANSYTLVISPSLDSEATFLFRGIV